MNRIQKIKHKLCEHYLKNPNYEKANDYMEMQDKCGKWNDINYACQDRQIWEALEHFKRLGIIAAVYFKQKSQAQKISLINGLCFWFKEKRENPNWWWNQIGLPEKMIPVVLVIYDELDIKEQNDVLSVYSPEVDAWATAANKAWLAKNVIIHGILIKSIECIKKGSLLMESTVCIADKGKEGIQPDFAYTQHGMQLYNNGYGKSFILTITWWAWFLEGTEAEFSNESIVLLSDFMLSGNRLMCRYDTIDFSSQSREIVRGYRKNIDLSMHIYDEVINLLAVLDKRDKKAQEYQKLSEYINRERNTYGAEHNKMFNSVGYMTHLRDGYYASVRMGSDKILGGDALYGTCINGENLLDGFGSYFLCVYMVDGYEYKNIFPVWSWAHLPGVTCPEVELPLEKGAHMKSKLVGGVSTGKYGVAAMDMQEGYSHDGEDVSFGGKKACFFFDDEIVHLGSQLYSDSKKPFNTTVNQCLLGSEVIADGSVLYEGLHQLNAKCVSHNNMCYYFPNSTKIILHTSIKRGKWSRISHADGVNEEQISERLFLLYIPHNSSSYEYIVYPSTDKKEITDTNIEILQNDDIQAVYNKKLNCLCAVFYKAGTLKYKASLLEADVPCAMIYDFEKDRIYKNILGD